MKGWILSLLIVVWAVGIAEGEDLSISEDTETCIECHGMYHPGIVEDWRRSRHAKVTPKKALKRDGLERRISVEEIPENLADVVVDITGSPYLLTKRVIDLDLHENAFTNIGYAILKATQVFARHRRSRANQHIILISDGDATAPHPSPQKYALREAAKAVKNGITISSVCINQESTDPELMRRISRIGKGRTYLVGPEGMTTALLEEHMAATFGG